MSLVRLRAIWITDHPPSVLWHCWLGHCLRNDLNCVEWDVKPCSTNQPSLSGKRLLKVVCLCMCTQSRGLTAMTRRWRYAVLTTCTVHKLTYLSTLVCGRRQTRPKPMRPKCSVPMMTTMMMMMIVIFCTVFRRSSKHPVSAVLHWVHRRQCTCARQFNSCCVAALRVLPVCPFVRLDTKRCGKA